MPLLNASHTLKEVHYRCPQYCAKAFSTGVRHWILKAIDALSKRLSLNIYAARFTTRTW